MKSSRRISIILFVFVLFVPPVLVAQWVKINTSMLYTSVKTFAVVGTNLFAGTDKGVFLSSDNGAHWTAANSGLPSTTVTSFVIVPNGTGGTSIFAGTDGSGVFNSSNNGANWSAVNAGLTDLHIHGLVRNGSNLFVGNEDGVFLSSDNGKSWVAVNNYYLSNISALAVLPGGGGQTYLFAASLNGVCYSTDNGSQWTFVGSDLPRTGISSFVVNGTNLFAGTDNGVFLSSDAGTHWTAVNSGLPSGTVHSFAVSPNGASGTNLLAGTDYFGVYLTTNNGASWSKVNSGMSNSADPTANDCVNALTVCGTSLFAGTQYGGWWRRSLSEMTGSANSSPGWSVQSSGVTTSLSAVKAVSNSVAWASGNSGVVLTTANGGSTWKSVGGGALGTGSASSIQSIDATDATNALVVFFSNAPYFRSFVYQTTNSGATWRQAFGEPNTVINSLKMYDAKNGIMLGDPVSGKWAVLRTTDGGATWNHIASEPADLGSHVGTMASTTLGTSNIWFGAWDGTAGSVYRSTDGGVSWSSKTIGSSQPMSLAFTNAQNGFASCYDSSIVHTSDGGATWTRVTIPGTGLTQISSCGNDLFASRGSNVYRSIDGGTTWNLSYSGAAGEFNFCNFVSSGSTLTGWAVTSTGKIAQFTGTTNATGVQTGNAGGPSTFALSQNYPNPFNPTTMISYRLTKSARVTLSIFNALGQLIQTLVDDQTAAGDYRVQWNASDVPSGIYFCRLRAGEFVGTRKMILLR